VSKRPTTAPPTLSSRLRVPVGRLRDLPIWSKLGLIMIVPIIATIVVGTNGLISNIGDANNADRARTLSGLAADSAALVHELQGERAKAVLFLSAPANTPTATQARTDFDHQAQLTDDASRQYRLHRSGIADVNDDFRNRLATIDTELSDLLVLRQQIAGGGADVLASVVVNRYRNVIEDLLGVREASAELATNAHLGADLRAASAISQMKEQASLERVTGLRVLLAKDFLPELRSEFNSALAGQQQDKASFQVISLQWQRDLFNKTVAGGDLLAATKVEGVLTSVTGETLPSDAPTTDVWDKAMFGYANLLRTVEENLDEHNIADATAERNLLQRNVLVGTGSLLGMLLLAILFAWIVARSMARSLRELRHGALTVAQYGLPQAVQRLRDPALSTQMSPQQVALQIAEPLPIRSRDEFGQVAEAFNAVHLEAVRTAAEQAALRASVATMFVNLARRSQILVDRLIGHLDRLERGEEDPDRLAELFQLDHLATRMRRNDENLLVLAGADSTRVQREPAPLMDVMRAAQSEVEHYTRIEFGMIDRDIEIAAHSVNDMVHMIAELLDNATAFSPPDSAVMVEARRVGDRAVLLVEDHGIGISNEQMAELNDRLANPPQVDVAVSRMMGLVVVARLAARHGVKVELRSARERGTIADVTLPATVLVPRALSGRSTADMPSAGMPAVGGQEPPSRPQSAPPAPRSPIAAPLALESGPTGAPTAPNGRPFGTLAGSGLFGGDRPRTDRFTSGNDNFGGGPVAPAAPAGAPGGGFGGYNGSPNGAPGSGGPTGYANGSAPGAPGGRPVSGPPSNGNGPHSGAQRGLPAWSDLTGVNGSETRSPQGPSGPSGFNDPLPQRRSGDGWPQDEPSGGFGQPGGYDPAGGYEQQSGGFGQPGGYDRSGGYGTPPAPYGDPRQDHSGQIPRQRPEMPEARAAEAPSVPPGVQPPAWPPVSPAPGRAADSAYTGADYGAQGAQNDLPRRPEAPAADMTAEIPQVRLAWEPTGSEADRGTPTPPPYADETMELPIFEELESAWFRTSKPGHDRSPAAGPPAAPAAPPQSPAPSNGAAAQPGPARGGYGPAASPVEVNYSEAPRPSYTPAAPVDASMPADPRRVPTDRPTADPAVSWHTAADEGWQAAAALGQDQEFATTDTGLPRRVPMSQLVPGGIEKTTTSSHRRTPESVRGLLAAYHRGVQRGRTRSDDPKTPEPTSAGPQNSQGGKEQEG
jgi:signal transduction histidine kinase